MLNGATPLFVTAVACVLAREWPSRATCMALGIGFVGALLMAVPDGGGSSQAFGIGLILLALLSYGFALNLARPLQQRNGALPLLWRALGVSMLLTAPLGLPQVLQGHWSPQPLMAMLLLGVFGTGIAQVLSAVAAGRLGPTLASSSAFLIPVVALMLGVVLRHEAVSGWSIAGAALCLAGAGLLKWPDLLTRRRSRRVEDCAPA